MVQSPDPGQQSEKMETIVHEEVVEVTERRNKKLDLVALEEYKEVKEHSFIEKITSVQTCKMCPLHCFQKKEKVFCKGKWLHKDWISKKMQYLKVEMAKVKNKIFKIFENVKSNAKEFIDKKTDSFPSSEGRSRVRSR